MKTMTIETRIMSKKEMERKEKKYRTTFGDEKYDKIVAKAEGFVFGIDKVNYNGFEKYCDRLQEQSPFVVYNLDTSEMRKSPSVVYEVECARFALFRKLSILKTGQGGEGFIKWNREPNLRLNGKVKPNDRKRYVKLLINEYKRANGFTDVIEYTAEELCQIWGNIEESHCANIRARLMKHGMLEPVKISSHETVYKLSRSLAHQGSQNNGKFSKLFMKKFIEIVDEIEAIEAREKKEAGHEMKYSTIGILHAMLPFFHHQTSLLCTNPEDDFLKTITVEDGNTGEVVVRKETIKEAYKRESKMPGKKRIIKHMSLSKLAEVLSSETDVIIRNDEGEEIERETKNHNIKYTTLKPHLEILQEAGAIVRVENKNTRILIHPELLLCRNIDIEKDEYAQFVLDIFNM